MQERATTGRLHLHRIPISKAVDTREFISLSDINRFIRQYFWTIAGPLLLSVAAACVYLFFATPIFIARSQILIDPKTPILREQTGEVNFSLDSAQVESHIAVLRSEKIAAAVIAKLGLQDDPEFQDTSRLNIGKLLATHVPEENNAESDFVKARGAITAFSTGLVIRRVGLSYAIEIAFSSASPDKAALIANATAEAYLRDQIQSKSESARQASRWLEVRLAELRTQMNIATHRVQAFRAKHDYSVDVRPEDVVEPNRLQTSNTNIDVGPKKPTLEELETTAETFRKIYESFLQAYTASVQRQSYPVSDARIITLAARPLTKSYPRTTLVLALALLVGLTMGFALAIARHSLGGTRT